MLPLLLAAVAQASAPEPRPWAAELEAMRALELPLLADDDLETWREFLAPRPEELGFEELPWIASFGEGLRAASEAGKPLLFWAMNGHPLGCT